MIIPKYRVYIKASGEMHEVAIVNSWTHSIHTIPLPKECSTGITNQMRIYSFDEIELMQSTGKKDINKIEIYGGDIILFSPLCGEIHLKKKTAVIWYDNATFFAKESFGNLTALQRLPPKEIKIIGNIHQNPELLEESPNE